MGQEVSTEIAQIQETMRVDRGRYNADDGMQSRLRELYVAQETGRPAAPGPGASEKTEIERVMRTDNARYWRDADMQARYLQILEAEEAHEASPAASSPDDGGLVHIPTPSEWKAIGGEPANYAQRVTLAREVNDILVAVEDGDRDVLADSFTRLPASVHGAAFAVLLDRRAVNVTPLYEADMQDLRRVPAYAALAKEWGHDAPRKFAVLQERLWRVLDRLNDHDVRRATGWLDALPKHGMIALARKLAR